MTRMLTFRRRAEAGDRAVSIFAEFGPFATLEGFQAELLGGSRTGRLQLSGGRHQRSRQNAAVGVVPGRMRLPRVRVVHGVGGPRAMRWLSRLVSGRHGYIWARMGPYVPEGREGER
jgi:hypothetical protein